MKKQKIPPYPDVHEVFNIPRLEMSSSSTRAKAAIRDIHKSLKALDATDIDEDAGAYIVSRLADIAYELGYIEAYVEEVGDIVYQSDSAIQDLAGILGDRLTADEEKELQKLRMRHILIHGN